jgi:hypothetical protein
MIRSAKHALFRGAGRLAACDPSDTIVVVGSPRSGTTWLLELLRALPGYKAINEPFWHDEVRQAHGFAWRPHLAPGARAPEKRRYLASLLSGDARPQVWHFEASTRVGQLLEHATHPQLIIKFTRLHRMLHWFTGQFDVRGLVFLVRHPCAVVASMLRHGSWTDDEEGIEDQQFAEPPNGLPASLQDPFGPILARIETRTEALATLWCIDHYVPLVQHADGSYPWMLVPYERLVARGREELRRMADALDIETTREMEAIFDEPSSSVKDRLHASAERQLSKWRRRLSAGQVSAILSIVEEAGLSHLYTDALEPNYDVMNEYQRPRWAW